MDGVQLNIANIPGDVGKVVGEKLDSVLSKNPDLELMREISAVLDGSSSVGVSQIACSHDCAFYKFCPLVSVDFERSVSLFKNVLSDKRHNLTLDHIRKCLLLNTSTIVCDAFLKIRKILKMD